MSTPAKDPCEHEHFQAEVAVDRVWNGEHEGEGTLAFHATVRIRCVGCRTRFRFPGLPMGLLWDRPTTDPTQMELRAPIIPDGHLTSVMADLPGFAIREAPTPEEPDGHQ